MRPLPDEHARDREGEYDDDREQRALHNGGRGRSSATDRTSPDAWPGQGNSRTTRSRAA